MDRTVEKDRKQRGRLINVEGRSGRTEVVVNRKKEMKMKVKIEPLELSMITRNTIAILLMQESLNSI